MDAPPIIGPRALSIREAAQLLRVSYATVYAHKKQLGFFRVGAAWRVWPEKLNELAGGYNDTRPARTERESKSCLSESAAVSISLTSARQAERELDALLEPATARKRRNTTTS